MRTTVLAALSSLLMAASSGCPAEANAQQAQPTDGARMQESIEVSPGDLGPIFQGQGAETARGLASAAAGGSVRVLPEFY